MKFILGIRKTPADEERCLVGNGSNCKIYAFLPPVRSRFEKDSILETCLSKCKDRTRFVLFFFAPSFIIDS